MKANHHPAGLSLSPEGDAIVCHVEISRLINSVSLYQMDAVHVYMRTLFRGMTVTHRLQIGDNPIFDRLRYRFLGTNPAQRC